MRSAIMLCLCIALGVSAVLAADAPAQASQGASTWLTDYFGAPSTKAKAAYDKGGEKADVCFRTSTWCSQDCNVNGTECDSSTEIDSLVCSACPESNDYESYRSLNYYRPGGLDLAGSRCILNKQFTTPVGLAGKPGINVIGTYTGTCYLIDDKDGHSSCGMPETCENVVASVQGVIYFVQQAVRVGPAASRPAEACTPAATSAQAAGYHDDEDRHYRDGPGEHYSRHDPDRYGDSDSYYTGPPQQQYVGNATVLSGPFTLHGFHHKPKFTSGHFQYSLFDRVALSSSTAGLPRLGDDVWKWELLADKQY